MVSTAMLSLKKLTNTSKTNNLPNNLSEIASNFFDYANCTPACEKQAGVMLNVHIYVFCSAIASKQ